MAGSLLAINPTSVLDGLQSLGRAFPPIGGFEERCTEGQSARGLRYYRPKRRAGLSSMILAPRMYRRRTSHDLWPVWRMISSSEHLFLAAWLTHPARRLCPAMDLTSIPARAAARLMISPIESGCKARPKTLPFLAMGRRRAPALIPVHCS